MCVRERVRNFVAETRRVGLVGWWPWRKRHGRRISRNPLFFSLKLRNDLCWAGLTVGKKIEQRNIYSEFFRCSPMCCARTEGPIFLAGVSVSDRDCRSTPLTELGEILGRQKSTTARKSGSVVDRRPFHRRVFVELLSASRVRLQLSGHAIQHIR